jgi:hypothetical protein
VPELLEAGERAGLPFLEVGGRSYLRIPAPSRRRERSTACAAGWDDRGGETRSAGRTALRARRRKETLRFLDAPLRDPLLEAVHQPLPSAPGLYLEISGVIADPSAGPDDVAAVIERETAMTAKVLQLANSAFFGLVAR